MVNEWTSNDVPSVSSLDLYNKRPDLDICGKQFGAAVAFEAMVKHLNAHYPKPENPEQLLRMCNEADLKRTRAESDADRWRRAHEIVEGERDLARDLCRELERERDVWRSRAEAAEARTAAAVARADIEKAIRPKFEQWQSQLEIPVDFAIDAVCDLLGIEAGQVTDPVEQKAAGWAAAVGIDWGHAEPEDVDLLMKVAAHVLGQGDRHVDQ